eukprot:COSAG04_NODE_3671_length_2617_cov_1.837172_1_plen_320_part_00
MASQPGPTIHHGPVLTTAQGLRLEGATQLGHAERFYRTIVGERVRNLLMPCEDCLVGNGAPCCPVALAMRHADSFAVYIKPHKQQPTPLALKVSSADARSWSGTLYDPRSGSAVAFSATPANGRLLLPEADRTLDWLVWIRAPTEQLRLKTSDEPAVRETVVIRPGEAGFNCMFPPTLLVTPHYLMVFGESRVDGSGHGIPGDVVIGQKQSTDLGRSWTPLRVAFNDTRRTKAQCGFLGCSVGQPAPIWDELRQRIVMPYTVDNLHVMASTSQGEDIATFGRAQNLSSVVKADPGIFVGTGPGGAIQMSNGRLLVRLPV